MASLARRPLFHVDEASNRQALEEEGICRYFFFHSSCLSPPPNNVPLARVKFYWIRINRLVN